MSAPQPSEFDDLGITPAVQAKLAEAAAAIRVAIEAFEAAFQAAPEGSDAETRCSEAIVELEDGPLYYAEWAPPADH